MKILKIKLIDSTFFNFLLIPILYELVIGGSGHYLEIGPITVRMALYVTAILISFVYYLNKKVIKRDIVFIILAFTFTTLLSIIVGYLNNAKNSAILEDLKTLSFFYILLFFSLAVKNLRDIQKITFIIKSGSLILSVVYISVIVLLLTGKINFAAFYQQQSAIGEVMFRNEVLFFYKGFVYLCVGFFFFLLSKGKYNMIGSMLLFLSILLTLTRGFILFTVLIGVYYIFFINKNCILKWIMFFVGVLASIITLPILFNTLGDKSGSDSMRYLQIDEVFSSINPISFIIGHGFGIGVDSRPTHMELSFLEIFHKQGILGVCFWLGIFIHIFLMYFNIKTLKYKEIALPFLLSVIFIILQSVTNPYMNNPIGLTMILITIVVFSKLIELQKNKC